MNQLNPQEAKQLVADALSAGACQTLEAFAQFAAESAEGDIRKVRAAFIEHRAAELVREFDQHQHAVDATEEAFRNA